MTSVGSEHARGTRDKMQISATQPIQPQKQVVQVCATVSTCLTWKREYNDTNLFPELVEVERRWGENTWFILEDYAWLLALIIQYCRTVLSYSCVLSKSVLCSSAMSTVSEELYACVRISVLWPHSPQISSLLSASLLMLEDFWSREKFEWMGEASLDACCVLQHDSVSLHVTKSLTSCAVAPPSEMVVP